MSATLDDIMREVQAIRRILDGKSAPAPKAGADSEINVPQPSRVIDSPENVEVHFGKNKGRPLGELGATSLSWYVAKWEPRAKRDGSLWDNDRLLQDAARTIWHARQKTLIGAPAEAPSDSEQQPPSRNEGIDEDVPF